VDANTFVMRKSVQPLLPKQCDVASKKDGLFLQINPMS